MRKYFKYPLYFLIAAILLGVGFGAGSALMLSDSPSIIVETKWKTVTTAPPHPYQPETPFHVDPAVICNTDLPTTTTTTMPPPVTTTTKPPVVTTQPPTTVTTAPVTTTQPPTTTTTQPVTTTTTELPPPSTTTTTEVPH